MDCNGVLLHLTRYICQQCKLWLCSIIGLYVVPITFTTMCFYLQEVSIDINSNPQGMQFISYVGLLQIGVGETGASCYSSYFLNSDYKSTASSNGCACHYAEAIPGYCVSPFDSLSAVGLSMSLKKKCFLLSSEILPFRCICFITASFFTCIEWVLWQLHNWNLGILLYFQICITCLCSCDSLRNWMA